MTNFSLNFFMQFSHKMPLYFFYTMVKKVKNDQKLKSGLGGGGGGVLPSKDSIPTKSFKSKNYQSSTALSKHVWSLKKKDTCFESKWEVQEEATKYHKVTQW